MKIDELLAELTLEEKASLTAGVGLWYLPSVERLGIPALKVSDGPSGVRGDSLIGRRSLSLPCGMAIGSTWNPQLVRRLGGVLAAEAVSKGVHVLLGPTVCIPRTPLAGRTFESFSEDPLLTARIAVAYIEGVQEGGVACCIKHFACNDQEQDRMTISAAVDERTLHEIHLPAFEAAVGEAGVWSIMTAYNRVNGIYCGEQPDLINGVLRDAWDFDGLVMSDWFGTHSTVPAAQAGLDLEMPGPSAWFGPRLAEAVQSGELAESVVDGQVRHLLTLMDRVGILEGNADTAPEREEDDPGRRTVARQLATEGTVLLVNDGLLPLDPGQVASIAIIGPNASQLAMGGGSSEVTPHLRRRVVEAVADRFPNSTVVEEVGCRIDKGIPAIDLRLVTPTDGEPFAHNGFTLTYFANTELAGPPVATETAHVARMMWIGPPHPSLTPGACSVRISGIFTPDATGPWQVGLESAGRSILRIDGQVILDNTSPSRGTGFYGAGSTPIVATYECQADRPCEMVIDLWPRDPSSPILGARLLAARPVVEDEFDRAVRVATDADVAVVVVGSNTAWESEGFDRTDLALPGEQNALIEAVLAVNPRTVVVVNAGSPLQMPWASTAGAVLMMWYPGEEGADALAEMLVGLAEPSGRLPISFPERLDDGPTHGQERYPGVDGTVTYAEGVFVGYRHYETVGVAPQFSFGHGLSYGSFEYGGVRATALGIALEMRNVATRRGTEVVQAYVRALEPRIDRPDRELAAFKKITLEPGEHATVELELTMDSFRYWDVETHGWRTDPGSYQVLLGASAHDIWATVDITLGVT